MCVVHDFVFLKTYSQREVNEKKMSNEQTNKKINLSRHLLLKDKHRNILCLSI
jgi:hypothetical protein